MIETLQGNYNSRLAKMFILNASFGIKCVWNVVDAFINPNTRAKIQMFSEGNPPELLNFIHPSQLLKEYGGEFEIKNPEISWPPVFPPQKYRDEYENSHFTEAELLAESLKKAQIIPSPKIAQKVKEISKSPRIPEKIYYLQGNLIEKYDGFNCKIEPCPNPIISHDSSKMLNENNKNLEIVKNDEKITEKNFKLPEISDEKKTENNKEIIIEEKKVEKINEKIIEKEPEIKENQIKIKIVKENQNFSEKAKETTENIIIQIKNDKIQKQNTYELPASTEANSNISNNKQELQVHDFSKSEKYIKKNQEENPACCACNII